jgi:hypothetical protein
MTSPDGVNWTIRSSAADNNWRSICYGNGIFVAVANSGTGNRVMTSGKTTINELSHNNVYQGEHEFRNNIGLVFDSAVLSFGVDSDVSLTHVADTGLLLNSTRQLQFGDSGTHIAQLTDGHLDLTADVMTDINAPITYVSGSVGIGRNDPDALLTLYQSGCPIDTYFELQHNGVTNPFTNYMSDDSFFQIDITSASQGGGVIRGFSEDASVWGTSLLIDALADDNSYSDAYMIFRAMANSGTGGTNIGNTEIGFEWKDYDQTLMTLDGDGDLVVTGDIKAGTGYLSTDGTAGMTDTVSNPTSITIKNGLVTACS